jgi:FtsH-binding integral membrane protein
LAVAAGLVAVACFVAVTLLLYVIFKRVDKGFVLLASLSGLVGLTFEALRWNPRGVDFGVVFDGIYCLLIGYLAFRSAFTPRILGVRMAIAGLAWLTHLSPALARSLNP